MYKVEVGICAPRRSQKPGQRVHMAYPIPFPFPSYPILPLPDPILDKPLMPALSGIVTCVPIFRTRHDDGCRLDYCWLSLSICLPLSRSIPGD